MPPPEAHFGVWLQAAFVGALRQRGSRVTFRLHPSYANNPNRAVLGLLFEQDLLRNHAAALRLPPWFSNLLPEGAMRRWIAQQAGVPMAKEVELLAEIGRDLAGAVTVLPLPVDALGQAGDDGPEPPVAPASQASRDERGRFSLAGVQLKLSMVATGDRLTVPLGGTLGDWIVKFPDATFPHLPIIEFATMELARRSGIGTPEIQLKHREELPDTPDALWRTHEEVAYAIRRFDRGPDRSLIHIEDLAQVIDRYPEDKYEGTCEGLAALVHRGEDEDSLRELVRRLAFNILVDNADAHLKNWSLLYENPRHPTLAPAYDLVAISVYPDYAGTMALSLAGQQDPSLVRIAQFDRLGVRPGLAPGELEYEARRTISLALRAWPDVGAEYLSRHPDARQAIGGSIKSRAASMLSA